MGLLFWDHHPIWSSVDLVPHGMEVGDRTEKYRRCLLFVCDRTSGERQMRFPFRKRAFNVNAEILFTGPAFLCKCLITITGVSVYCGEDKCHLYIMTEVLSDD